MDQIHKAVKARIWFVPPLDSSPGAGGWQLHGSAEPWAWQRSDRQGWKQGSEGF